jgi:hypothetical protein
MPTDDELKNEYFVYATQYYAAARFAAISKLMPVAGLLFHYALEMFLKGHLCLTLKEHERKNLSHRLEEEVWPAFKNVVQDSDLDRYDRVISAIDIYWDRRYPDDILQTGMTERIGFGAPPPIPTVTPKPLPHFELTFDSVDSLVALIFKKSGKNPKIFKAYVFGEARDYLAKENKTGIW